VSTKLGALLTSSKKSKVRRAAIQSLIKLAPSDITTHLAHALKDRTGSVRVAALDGCVRADITDQEKLDLLRSVIFDKKVSERQSAISSLGKLPLNISTETFKELLDLWSKDDLAPEVRLDLAEAIEATEDQSLISALADIKPIGTDGDLMAAYSDCLSGGDAGKGNLIIWNHTGAQCIRCHEMHDYGGIAGPPLTHIGDALSPEQLLESLILPSATIAPGYGMVSIITNDDREIDGMLIKESPDLLTIKDASGNIVEVAITDVAERIDAMSGMTDMTKILTKKEIRDVVAFLSTLKKTES